MVTGFIGLSFKYVEILIFTKIQLIQRLYTQMYYLYVLFEILIFFPLYKNLMVLILEKLRF